MNFYKYGFYLATLCLAGLAVYILANGGTVGQAGTGSIHSEVKTRKITVVGSKGKPRIVMGEDSQGMCIEFLSNTGGNRIKLHDGGKGAWITLYDQDDKARVNVGLRAGKPLMSFNTAYGKKKILLGLDGENVYLNMLGNKDKKLIDISADSLGGSKIEMRYENENDVMSLIANRGGIGMGICEDTPDKVDAAKLNAYYGLYHGYSGLTGMTIADKARNATIVIGQDQERGAYIAMKGPRNKKTALKIHGDGKSLSEIGIEKDNKPFMALHENGKVVFSSASQRAEKTGVK